MADKVVIETLPSGEKKTYVIPVYAPVTAPSSQQWYATAQDLFNRGYLSVEIDGERIPVPNTPNLSHSYDRGMLKINDTQDGYFKNKSDQEQRKNYQRFYSGGVSYTNEFGKKEIWKLRDEYIQYQQILSDTLGITTYKPNPKQNQSKYNKAVTAISTMPRTAGQPRKPAGAGAIDPEAIPQDIPEESIQTGGAGQPRKPAGAGTVIDVIGEQPIVPGPIAPEPIAPEPIAPGPIAPISVDLPSFDILPEAAAEPIAPEPINETITNNMITQRLDHFRIENGRAKGQITFTLNNNFNPFYYGKDLVNIIQFKTKTGANILPFIKQNRLRFTETERDEVIQYDESVGNNTIADLESFVWLGTTQPTAFSSVLRSEIHPDGATVPTTNEGFLGAGLGISAIAFAIAMGFLIDMRRT